MIEKFYMWLAWKMPKRLVYWCSIRLGCNATQGEHSTQDVVELKFMDGLKRWKYD